jgi:hypothetical protein
MHGLCWVLRMCRAELPKEFVLRVEGTYWRCFPIRRWLSETHQPKKPRRHRRFARHRTFRVAKTRQTVAGNRGVANFPTDREPCAKMEKG